MRSPFAVTLCPRAFGSALALALVLVLGASCEEPRQPPPEPAAASSGADCGSYPCLSTARQILDWQPSMASPFDLTGVPLAARPPAAGPGVISTVDLGTRSYQAWFDRSPQGGSSGNVYNFVHWPYVRALNYYHHSLLAVPPTVWTNAAHRNGVPVLGTVTSDCAGCVQEMDRLFDPANGLQPADQLRLIADTYGFDGWLIDVEGGAATSQNVIDNLRRLSQSTLSDGRPVRVLYYTAGAYQLDANLQPAFEAAGWWETDYAPFSCDQTATPYPASTYGFLAGQGQADQRFATFWNLGPYQFSNATTRPCQSGPEVIDNGNPPVPGASGSACLSTACLFGVPGVGAIRAPGDQPPAPPFYQSVAFFGAQWTLFGGTPDNGQPAPDTADARDAFRAAEHAFWVGYEATYSGAECALPAGLNAVSAFITPATPQLAVPFVTRFNQGEGAFFHLEGRAAAASSWNLLSIQDVAPTWLCRPQSKTSVTAQLSYDDAWDGGSALQVAASLAPGEDGEIALWDTRLQLPANPGLTLTTRLQGGSGLAPYLRLTFSDGTSTRLAGPQAEATWTTTSGPIQASTVQAGTVPQGAGRTVARIAVGLTNPGRARAQAAVLFGELKVVDLEQTTPPALIEPTVDPQGNLAWNDATADTWYYNVYLQLAGSSCASFLGRTLLPRYDLASPLFPSTATASGYLVQPVNRSGLASPLGTELCS